MYRRWHRIIPFLIILALLCSACGTPELPASESAASGGNETSSSSDTAAEPAAAPAEGQPSGLKDVPRNRTLIMAGLGGEQPGAFTDMELFNSYSPGLSRSGFTQACTEA
ncbi:MAG: hypothetical protein KDE31_14455, partial [Caldilineaceae bacterium]|nr:hypothetical protein [Caldilineaceae bacterium]